MSSLRSLSGLAAAAVVAAVTMGSGRAAAQTDALYRLGPDSEPQPGVPQGTVTEWEKLPSQAYPGTLHDFCVYVPAQYDPATPAALMIFQDGQAWLRLTGDYRVPYVFDNLIYRREMPVTIAVFINPGRTPEQPEASAADWGDRSTNRPQEYNALDDKYARVITDELMPVLTKRYNLSPKPEDRAIGGASSGAIAAFTVAWHRPDQFRKVLSTIGSFTNIRGGHVYPDLIRGSDPKPIRIFLQDGLNDNRGVRGEGAAATYAADRDWHAQNIKMVSALTEKGYDVNYTWGIGTHSNKQGGAILPDMLRWLWRDYVRPPDDARDSTNRMTLVPQGFAPPAQPAVGPPAPPREWSAAQLKRVSYHSAATGEDRDYYVYLPEGFAQKDRWPVLMTLSGNGERGDGKGDLDYVLANGPLFEAWSQRRRLPFVIIAPQLPMFNQAGQGFITSRTRARIRYPRADGPYPPGPNYTGTDRMDGVPADPQMPFGLDGTPEGWSVIEDELLAMIDRTLVEFKGDRTRVYLTGLSTGGFGTWYLAGKHPERFAAIAPVAAFCHPDLAGPIAKAKLPLWVFTGGRDPYFKVQYFYPALNLLEAQGHPEVRFSIEADMGHNSWNRVYAGQDLYDWFLTHQRTDVK
jgi:enterochelin esterase-like enzyme